jgi:hypothetical protein
MKVKIGTIPCWLGELGFLRQSQEVSAAGKAAALAELAAAGDETQAVRWLLKRGVTSEQARSWREAYLSGRLTLPAGADLAQARQAWERPQLSPAQKWDRIREYAVVLSRSNQVTAGRWLRGRRLTWWELEDWYREPGVVPDQGRDTVAPVFDGPAGVAAVSLAPRNLPQADAGEIDAGLVQGRGEGLPDLDPMLVEDSTPDAESLFRELFPEGGQLRPEAATELDSLLEGSDSGSPGSGRGERPAGGAGRLESEDIRRMVNEYERVPRCRRAAWLEDHGFSHRQLSRWAKMIADGRLPSGFKSRPKLSERLGPAGKAAQVVEYQRAILQWCGGGSRWVAGTEAKRGSLPGWLGELGFMRRENEVSAAERVAALAELAAVGDEMQVVRWLLKRGVSSEQARSWRDAFEQGRLILPAGADLIQARRVWERPQLSPEQKWDRIWTYAAIVSRRSQIFAGRWLRGQRLTWWELDDWYREPGVVPEQDRDVVARWFDRPADQPAVSVAPTDRVEVPLDDAPGETGRTAFEGTGVAEGWLSGGLDSPDAESMCRQLFQEDWIAEDVGAVLWDARLPEPLPVPSPSPCPAFPSSPRTASATGPDSAATAYSASELCPTSPAASPTQWWATLLASTGPTLNADEAGS